MGGFCFLDPPYCLGKHICVAARSSTPPCRRSSPASPRLEPMAGSTRREALHIYTYTHIHIYIYTGTHTHTRAKWLLLHGNTAFVKVASRWRRSPDKQRKAAANQSLGTCAFLKQLLCPHVGVSKNQRPLGPSGWHMRDRGRENEDMDPKIGSYSEDAYKKEPQFTEAAP